MEMLPKPTPVPVPDHRAHMFVELIPGASITSSLGGTIDSGAPAFGVQARLHAGYESASGFSFGVAAGYLAIEQETMDRPGSVTPAGLAPNAGRVDDDVWLSGVIVGAVAGWRPGRKRRTILRLGAGALFGSAEDDRKGKFIRSTGAEYTLQASTSVATTYVYVAPEIRLSLPIGEHFELSSGLALMFLFRVAGGTSNESTKTMGPDGAVEFGFHDETVTGGPIFAIAPEPGLAVRFAF